MRPSGGLAVSLAVLLVAQVDDLAVAVVRRLQVDHRIVGIVLDDPLLVGVEVVGAVGRIEQVQDALANLALAGVAVAPEALELRVGRYRRRASSRRGPVTL